MQVMYQSTRGKGEPVTASQAILKGLSEDGGLFVPTQIPALDVSMDELSRMTYQETAYQVMSRLLTDFTEEELRTCINRAYDKKFDTDVIAPLKEADGAYYLELFHGPTIAFKDMALSILPYLMTTAARKNNVKNEIVILTATSGDTGKAALAGFADVPGTRIIVFYPKDVYKRQGMESVFSKQYGTLTFLSQGDKVFTADFTKQLLDNSTIATQKNMPDYAGMAKAIEKNIQNIQNLSGNTYVNNFYIDGAQDTDSILKEIDKHLDKKIQAHDKNCLLYTSWKSRIP